MPDRVPGETTKGPTRLVIGVAALEDAIREWVHESPLNRCNAGSDTCESWPVVDEIMAPIRHRAEKFERGEPSDAEVEAAAQIIAGILTESGSVEGRRDIVRKWARAALAAAVRVRKDDKR